MIEDYDDDIDVNPNDINSYLQYDGHDVNADDVGADDINSRHGLGQSSRGEFVLESSNCK